MTTIAEMYARFKRLDLRKQLPILIEQSKETVIALNQRQLYTQSLDQDGVPLRFYASNSYAFEKERRNPAPGFGRPDLYQTGAFYRGFYLSVTSSTYSVNSRDSKTKKLESKYGKIFGLTEESKDEYVQRTLYNGVISYIERTTGIQMR